MVLNCNFTVDGLGAKMSGLINVAPNDTQLLHAVAEIGPISVAIAAEDDFQFYSSGIFTSTDCEGADLDHAVLVVGYGISEKGHKYYIVKNSWGTSWGMDGYIYYSKIYQICVELPHILVMQKYNFIFIIFIF